MIDPLPICIASEELYNASDFDGAYQMLSQAIADHPGEVRFRGCLGALLLLYGRWQEAWNDLLAHCDEAMGIWMQIQMQKSLAGKTILLIDDQGRGDCIQNIRFARKLAENGLMVVVKCRTELVPIIQNAPGVLLATCCEVESGDFRCNLSYLPAVFGQKPDAEPAEAYLTAPALQKWTAKHIQPPIGVCWQGNPEHGRTHCRDFHKEFFSNLRNYAPDRMFCNLNPWASGADGILDPEGECADFGVLANAISAMDLVITVDTAIAHLAGSLGTPTWLLLSDSPDGRWMLGRDSTPWYGSMRIFRQGQPGELFARLASELEAFAGVPA